jgi:hypothetical protein
MPAALALLGKLRAMLGDEIEAVAGLEAVVPIGIGQELSIVVSDGHEQGVIMAFEMRQRFQKSGANHGCRDRGQVEFMPLWAEQIGDQPGHTRV